MKIIIAGAGIGGLVAAELLGKNGHEVTVYEKEKEDNISYDWHDDVSRDIFSLLDLPLPEAQHYFTKGCWTFIPPNQKKELYVEIPPEKRDLSIERRHLASLYLQRTVQYASIHFGKEIKSLIIEDGEVKGIIADGKKVYADLVIDNSGVFSSLRKALPDAYKIEKRPSNDEVIYAYRAFHKRAEGSPDPQYTNKVYLKHLGEEGISWCILDPSGTVNVLIGRIGGLPKQTLDRAYAKLKESNPIISDQVVRGGGVYSIPVRHPALRFSGKGYALIGDAAFMTIPMMGSGIANSMLAGRILASEIIKAGDVSPSTLWRYQVAYYKQVGHIHTGADLLKRWMLSVDGKDIDFLLNNGVINAQDLRNGSTGEDIALSFATIIDKVKRAFPRIGLLLNLKGTITLTKKAKQAAYGIPEVYDPVDIDKWAEKLRKHFINTSS